MIHLQMLTPEVETLLYVSGLIKNVWPEPYAAAAIHATQEDAFDVPKGQIFLVYAKSKHTARMNMLVGITGYFDIDCHNGTAYLRWTGIATHEREQGYFREAIRLLTLQLQGANPMINRLIELVPDNEYGRTMVMPAFEKVGFKARPDLPIPPGEDSDWPVIPYVLNF